MSTPTLPRCPHCHYTQDTLFAHSANCPSALERELSDTTRIANDTFLILQELRAQLRVMTSERDEAIATVESLSDHGSGCDAMMIDALRAERDALLADKARLDWLESDDWSGKLFVRTGWVITPPHGAVKPYPSLRTALDAARP